MPEPTTIYVTPVQFRAVEIAAAPRPEHPSTRQQERAYRRRFVKALAQLVSPGMAKTAQLAKKVRVEIVEDVA